MINLMPLRAIGSQTQAVAPSGDRTAARARARPLRSRGSLAIGAGLAVTLIALLALVEWRALHPDGLHRLPSVAPLDPSTAVGLLLGGAGLLLLALPRPGRARRWAGRACGLLTAAVGLFGLAQTVTGVAVEAASSTVGWLLGSSAAIYSRPTVAAAAALLLNGAALVTLDTRPRWRVTLTSTLLTVAAGISLVALLGVIFEQAYRSSATPVAAMPLLTALAMLELSLGVMLARPPHGLLGAFIGTGLGNSVARRLAPALILLPFGTGLLTLAALRTGVGGPEAAITVGTVLTIVVMVLLVARAVRALNDTDARHRELLCALRDERDFTASLFQSLNEAVVVLDTERRVLEVNRRWCELSGRPRAELLGQGPPYPWQRPAGGGAAKPEQAVTRPDGTVVPVLTTTAEVPGADGRPRAYVATYVDITDRKRAEEALAAHVRTLEQVNGELRHANERLERALAFKADLMAMVTHEISQPLSSMASLAELLSADWAELSDEVRHDLAVKVDRNARRLTTMVNGLTLLFRLDAGAVTARRAPVPLAEVIEEVVAALPVSGEDLTVTVAPEICVLTDRVHLEQIVQHLLGNATRYGRPPIEVAAVEDRDGVTLTVRDHGPGVPPEAVPKLFDRFGHGHGLGLFIARHLVEANGGAIRYEPAEPTGARLVLRLERAATGESRPAAT